MTPMIAPLALAVLLGAPPADCPKCDAPPPAKTITRVFAVMDLVTPIPDFTLHADRPAVVKPILVAATGLPARDGVTPPPVALVHYTGIPNATRQPSQARECRAAELLKMIKNMVRPYSWDTLGGAGTLAYYEIGGAMVVHNSPEVIAEIDELLKTLRKLQETSISVECRLVTVPAGFGNTKLFGQVRNLEPANKTAFLTQAQTASLLQDVQQMREANILQTPKYTLFNGQTIETSCGDEVMKVFTTGLDVQQHSGQRVIVPRQTTERMGTFMGLQATITENRQAVCLAFEVRQAELDGPVEMVPVKYAVTVKSDSESMLTPLTITQVAQKAQAAGETKELLLPVTQYVQKPRIVHRSAKRVVTLPDGGTVAVPLGTRTGNQEVIALLTTRVLIQSEEEVKTVSESPAAKLVAEYHRACAAGRTEEAMRLALQALAADPKCFSNESR